MQRLDYEPLCCRQGSRVFHSAPSPEARGGPEKTVKNRSYAFFKPLSAPLAAELAPLPEGQSWRQHSERNNERSRPCAKQKSEPRRLSVCDESHALPPRRTYRRTISTPAQVSAGKEARWSHLSTTRRSLRHTGSHDTSPTNDPTLLDPPASA